MTDPVTVPESVDALRAIGDPQVRVAQAQVLLAKFAQDGQDVLRIRDQAVCELLDRHGPAATARLSGLSLSAVKAIRARTCRRRPDRDNDR